MPMTLPNRLRLMLSPKA